MNKRIISIISVLVAVMYVTSMISGQLMNHSAGIKFSSDKYLFEGTITNAKVSPGTFVGLGIYDKSCVDVGNGLTRCDAGIKTEEYGILNFNYLHNMRANPCIARGDRLNVEIVDSSGTARVQKY